MTSCNSCSSCRQVVRASDRDRINRIERRRENLSSASNAHSRELTRWSGTRAVRQPPPSALANKDGGGRSPALSRSGQIESGYRRHPRLRGKHREVHLARIFEKLGVENRNAASMQAVDFLIRPRQLERNPPAKEQTLPTPVQALAICRGGLARNAPEHPVELRE